MLPNSRMIPNNNNNRRQRSNSMMNDNTLKRGFMSRLLTTTTKEYNQPIYESIQSNEDNYHPRSSSSTSSINKSGFSKLFKKKEKLIQEEDEDIPKVRPIKVSKHHSKIPLAPPPQHIPRNNRTVSQPDLQQLLAQLPTLEPMSRPLSVRKSTGSYSIYSTFGGTDDEEPDTDDDDFVDATGVSQEDIEKELKNETLAKRLSGGHYGSAGGLLLSMVDDDVLATSMLNWKRQSDSQKRNKEEDWKHKEQEEVDQVKKMAFKLWNEDESIMSKEKMAEWLGQPKPFQHAVLVEYMHYFEFNDMRLDNAFRKLCSKLYFKAEAQQIDRILESFAHRYWECNPHCLMGSADIVYAVVYSLLLLNTDLHVAQGSHTRMTRSEFIRNTMSTIRDQRDHETLTDNKAATHPRWEMDLEHDLKEMYLSVKHYQILQPLSSLSKRSSVLRVGLKRSVGSIIRKSGRESMLVPDDRSSFSSHSASPSLFTSEPPYFKEGVVMRKHLLETSHQKARHREWRECLLEVSEGELRMYAIQPTADKSLFRQSTVTDLRKDQWMMSGKIVLNHTLSNPLPPPGYNRHRPHVFALQQADGGVYLFQVVSMEQAQEWVATCNYWAARGSKEPLPGAISNMEYGWGPCLETQVDADSVGITDWIPPQPTMVSSGLEEKEQYQMLQKHLEKLNQEINQHRDIKNVMLIRFPSKSNNYSKVLNNWETKSKYLLHDIIKYQHYCDALEKSLERTPEKLIFKSSQVDLFQEINQELSLQKCLVLGGVHGQ